MRRFLVVWGPDLVGGALATGCGMGVVACGMAARWLFLVPAMEGHAESAAATVKDLIDIPSTGPARREDAFDSHCKMCVAKDQRLAAVTKDRDELREALLTLQLEPAPRTGRTP